MIPYERSSRSSARPTCRSRATTTGRRSRRKEIDYLCEAASRYAEKPITPGMVVWSYSGVRPLYDDGSENPFGGDPRLPPAARHRSGAAGRAGPFGVRRQDHHLSKARRAGDGKALRAFSRQARLDAHRAPPGGNLDGRSFRGLLLDYRRRHPRPAEGLAHARAPQARALAEEIIGTRARQRGSASNFGGGLYERELEYLVRNEWAREAEDVLWRRTKCGCT